MRVALQQQPPTREEFISTKASPSSQVIRESLLMLFVPCPKGKEGIIIPSEPE